jgi:hypothetical protein
MFTYRQELNSVGVFLESSKHRVGTLHKQANGQYELELGDCGVSWSPESLRAMASKIEELNHRPVV